MWHGERVSEVRVLPPAEPHQKGAMAREAHRDFCQECETMSCMPDTCSCGCMGGEHRRNNYEEKTSQP